MDQQLLQRMGRFVRPLILAAACAIPLGIPTAGQTADAAAQVDIVVGRDAPPLEHFAAEEMAVQLRRLFQAEVRIGHELPAQREHAILLGSPATNPLVQRQLRTGPDLSAQGHLLRSVTLDGKPALVVAGGSPVATLWAAYELGHHFGVRYLLYGDLDPVQVPPLKLDDLDQVFEPSLPVRTWRTLNDFPIGPESWGLEEQRRLLKQLAKLKYNRVLLSVYPWQPFVDFEFGGMRKSSALLWYGYQYRVDGDTPGRAVFAGAKLFENPDFVGQTSYQDRIKAGVALAGGIMDTAHELGMSVGLAISPLEFPKEFTNAIPGAKTVPGLEQLTIGPGPAQEPDDPRLLGLARAQIRAYLDTYPDLDHLYLTVPEFPDWHEPAEAAWKSLAQRAGLAESVQLPDLIQAARERALIASGERGARSLKGNIVALEFFHQLLADPDLLRSKRGQRVTPVLVQLDPALFTHLDKLIPPGCETLHFLDYTSRRVAEQKGLLASVPAAKVPSSLILTLADDNVGVLPQMSNRSLSGLAQVLRSRGWQGFSTRYWIVGDLDLSAYLLSRASFADDVSAQEACRQLVTPICGEGVVERVQKGFDLIEDATTLIDQNDIGFSFPVPGMVLKHYESGEPAPAWWATVRDHYLHAMNEMYRANTRAREGGRSYTLYFARRCEFAYEYMNCVEAVRNAGVARKQKDQEKQLAELEKAVESMHAAMMAMGAVARSNSDRGVIAVLNTYGYQPLQEELERVETEGK